MKLETARLILRLQSPQELLGWYETLDPTVKAEISPQWLERLRSLTEPDPWTCMFKIGIKTTGEEIGMCGFKSPPNEIGEVEIAYGIDEPYRVEGYATDAVNALVDFAKTIELICVVCAHTKADNPASEKVLNKSGFSFTGIHQDPEDGEVNRWELRS